LSIHESSNRARATLELEEAKGSLQFLSADYSVGKHLSAGVFDGRAGGQASCEAGHFDSGVFEQGAYVERCAIACQIRIGCHNDFLYITLADPLDELVDGQIVRLDTLKRRDVAAEDMIDPFAGARLFKGDEVFRLLNNTD
jgi:hypothetical protein